MNKQPWQILLIDSNEADYHRLRNLIAEIEELSLQLDWVTTSEAGLMKLERDQYDVCLVANRLGEEREGLALLRRAVERDNPIPLILLLDQADWASECEGLSSGAADCLVKSQLNAWLLRHAVHLALAHNQVQQALREQVVTVSLENARRLKLEEQLQKLLEQRGRQVQTSTEIAQEIAIAPTLDELFRRVVNLIQKRLGYYHAQVYTLEKVSSNLAGAEEANLPGDYELVLQEGTGGVTRMMKAAGYKVALGAKKSLAAQAARSGQPVLAPDVFQQFNWLPNALLPETRAEIAVPIKLGNQIMGILDVQNDTVGGLTEEDQLLLQGLCGQIAVAIDYRRTEAEYQQTARALAKRAEEMMALYQTSLEVNAELDLSSLLQMIVGRAALLLGTETGVLILAKPDQEKLEVVAVHNGPASYLGLSIPWGQGIAGTIVQTGDPLVIPDYRHWAGRLAVYSNESIGRIMGVPVKQGHRTIGSLHVFDQEPGDFTADQVQLLNLFATYAAIVIQNSRLFEAEQLQREVAETLGEVAKMVNSTLELNEVLDKALLALEKMLPYDAAHIMLIEQEHARMVASRRFIDQETIMGKALPLTALPLSMEAIRRRQPLLVPDTGQEPLFKPPVIGSVPVRCLILIPLITREQVTSILSIINYTPNSYSAREVELAARFGQQVAAAIANAQLYQQVQRYNLELEQRITDRTAELHAAQERLVRQEKLAVLGQLAGGVAHEVRNPLGVISNAVYFLQMILSQTDDIVKEYLEIISSRVQEAEKIVTDLLNFSRTKPADKESITLSELVTEALERHPPPEQVKVIDQIPPDLPPIVVDTRQIGQVLANLVTNAYQAMPEGGTLTLAAHSETKEVRLKIIDTGIGMSDEIRQKIFEPLFTTKAKGIGLGLVISKNLMELNGGTIEVESVEGQGSCFILSLPVEEASS